MTLSPQRWRGPEPWFDGIAQVLAAMVWLRVDVRVVHPERLPRTGPVVLPANHVSRLDPPVVGVTVYRLRRRVRFLAVAGLFDVAVLGWALRATRMIPVHRGMGAERMVADACAALAADQAIIVYPEGTIPAEGQRLPGRPGAGLLALAAADAGVPVVPMASWGLTQPVRGTRLRRRRATVTFGPPVDLSAWAGRRDQEAQRQASEAALTAVRALLDDARRTDAPGGP